MFIELDRRSFLRTLGFGSLSLLGNFRRAAAKADKPNVLFIAIDDLNDWIGYLGGHPGTKTPNLDRLAERSVLFTNAHCAAPVCNPSRVALLTGLRPSTTGIYVNKQDWRLNPIFEGRPTLPQHFMANGYTSLGSGKIYHLAWPHPESWDEYWPSKEQTRPEDPEPQNRPLNGIPGAGNFDWGPLDVANEEMGDWQVVDWVNGQLAKEHEKPFFLAAGIYKPHLPWYVPRQYFERFPLEEIVLPDVKEDDLNDVPDEGRKFVNNLHAKVIQYDQWKQAVQAYLACISFADDCVGRLLDALDSSAYRDNTIIVLWSDHGWHLGEKLHWKKFTLWEEATHNVLMISAPGVSVPGARFDDPVSLLDIYPTLIELCGLTPGPPLEGSSLVSFLKNPELSWERPALCTYKFENHSVRSKKWRYTRYNDGGEELYDRENDPMEWTNMASDEALQDVKAQLAEWLPTINAPEFPVAKVMTDEDDLPDDYVLYQNYPNPFNPSTTIRFDLLAPCFAQLLLYNAAGQKVRTLAEGRMNQGSHSVSFDGRDDKGQTLASGLYYYQLIVENEVITRRMVMVH